MSGRNILIALGIAVGCLLVGFMLIAGTVIFLSIAHVDLSGIPVVSPLLSPSIPTTGAPAAASPSPPAGASQLTDLGGYKTENNWIAAMTAEEIAGLAWPIVNPGKPFPTLKATATVDPEKQTIHLELSGWGDARVTTNLTGAYAWDPMAYAPFARQLLEGKKSVEPGGGPGFDLLTDLLESTGEVLGQKDVALSQALTSHPASAQLHEQAALLLLTTAARENAGRLSDIRTEMNRACAHLALARALIDAEPSTPTSFVDNAFLLTLTGREVDALAAMDKIKALFNPPSSLSSWMQVLTLLNKNDWRAVTPDRTFPLLVKIVWAQTVCDNFTSSSASPYFDKLGDLEAVPDWGRAMLSSGSSLGVEAGHLYCQATFQHELDELRSVQTAEGSPTAADFRLSDVFKNPVGRSTRADADGKPLLRVIGLDLFQDIAERHMIAEAAATHFWMRNAWSVPEEDAKFVQIMRQVFNRTRDEQFLDIYMNAATTDDFPLKGHFKTDVAEVPPCLSLRLELSEPQCDQIVPYFGWGIPFGAPFDVKNRAIVMLNAMTSHHHPPPNLPTFRSLLPLAPDSYMLASWILMLNDNRHIPNNGKEEYALLSPFFDYNGFALYYFRGFAEQQSDIDDAMLLDVLTKSAALDANAYFELGDFQNSHGKPDDAAASYRKGAAEGADKVLFANSIRPLVEYDYDHGNQAEALEMSQRAAEVYSATGISTYMWLLAKLGKYDEAETWAKREDERYHDDAPSDLYIHFRDHYHDQFDAKVKQLYPNGFTTVSLADFHDAPAQGCLFETASEELTKAGLQAGDVIVALDSHPVLNSATYQFARNLKRGPLDLIIWRNGRYLEITASPPNRLFGNRIYDYKP